MFHHILAIQLLTLCLDPRGVAPEEVRQALPEEFADDAEGSGESESRAPRPAAGRRSRAAVRGWNSASADLGEALEYLVDQRLATIDPDGRVLPLAQARGEWSSDPDAAFGLRDESPSAAPERADALLDFDQPRLES